MDSFCLFSSFSNTNFTEILLTQAGFELVSSVEMVSTLTTWTTTTAPTVKMFLSIRCSLLPFPPLSPPHPGMLTRVFSMFHRLIESTCMSLRGNEFHQEKTWIFLSFLLLSTSSRKNDAFSAFEILTFPTNHRTQIQRREILRWKCPIYVQAQTTSHVVILTLTVSVLWPTYYLEEGRLGSQAAKLFIVSSPLALIKLSALD